MKITMLSKKDYCASGWKTCEAIRKYTDHDIELFALKHNFDLNHPHGIFITKENRKEIQDRIDDSDIIHIKGDFPATKNHLGFKIDKPMIQTVSGGLFRKREHGGLGKVKVKHYDLATLKTSYTPDLCYPGYSDIWTPHPIDSYDNDIEWVRSDPPLLIHSVLNKARRSVKGTAFILEVLNIVQSKMECDVSVIEQLTHQEVVEAKKRATILFDQFRVGFYGNSAIEAMQYGIPTCAWISPWAIEQAGGRLEDCPVITIPEKDPNQWANKIIRVLNSDLEELSRKTKQWCDDVHSYQSVANHWDNLYTILNLW